MISNRSSGALAGLTAMIGDLREIARHDGVGHLVGSIPYFTVKHVGPLRTAAIAWGRRRNPHIRRGVVLDLDQDLLENQVPRILFGRYEAAIASFIERYLPPSADVVELGGGIGFTACVASNHLDDDTTHVVVEPNTELIDVLHHHKWLNRSDFTVVNRAYSPLEDVVTLDMGGDFTRGRVSHDGSSSDEISTITLSDIVEAYDLSEFVPIIDIEGAEVELVRAEIDVLEERCPMVIIECHPTTMSDEVSSEVQRSMIDAGFVVVERRGGFQPKYLFVRTDRLQDEDGV